MPYEIVMPQLGLTMTEGSVDAWFKKPGEHVQKGEMLFTVSTDKVDMEVESTASGFLNTVVDTGAMVPVGTVIAILTDRAGETIPTIAKPGSSGEPAKPSDARASAEARAVGQLTPVAASAKAADSRDGRSFPASPRARSLAKSLGVDIAGITPLSGTRIVEADVTRHHDSNSATKFAPMSSVKRITAERTTQSFERAPHFYLGREVNAGGLVGLRQELQGTAQRQLGFNITYTDFLLRAMALALREEPAVNAYWQDGRIVLRESIDVAFATQTEKGLFVPVIPYTEKLSLFAIALRRKDLSDRAREGGLHVEDLKSASATLSNLGMHGVDWFQAILNPPQSAILATGSITKRPLVVDGRLEVAETLILSLSADHRVLDGVVAAKFVSAIARMLETPLELLV